MAQMTIWLRGALLAGACATLLLIAGSVAPTMAQDNWASEQFRSPDQKQRTPKPRAIPAPAEPPAALPDPAKPLQSAAGVNAAVAPPAAKPAVAAPPAAKPAIPPAPASQSIVTTSIPVPKGAVADTPANRAVEARRYVQSPLYAMSLDLGLKLMPKLMDQQLAQQNLPPQQRECYRKIGPFIQTMFTQERGRLQAESAKVYAQVYTATELRALANSGTPVQGKFMPLDREVRAKSLAYDREIRAKLDHAFRMEFARIWIDREREIVQHMMSVCPKGGAPAGGKGMQL